VALDRLLKAGDFACRALQRAPASRVALAYAAKCDGAAEAHQPR
jgi:hydroxymethylglutaryl-CoA lyase